MPCVTVLPMETCTVHWTAGRTIPNGLPKSDRRIVACPSVFRLRAVLTEITIGGVGRVQSRVSPPDSYSGVFLLQSKMQTKRKFALIDLVVFVCCVSLQRKLPARMCFSNYNPRIFLSHAQSFILSTTGDSQLQIRYPHSHHTPQTFSL